MRGALPEINLPADRPRRTDGGRPGRKCEVALSIPLTAELRRLGRRSSGTLFMTLLAGFAALSYRWTGERDLTVGTPVAGRDHRDIEDLVGFFVNTVAMRVRPGGAQTFSGLLAQVRTVALRALDHQGLPFADLVERLQPDRDALRNPLFNVMFILQTVPPPQLELPGLTVEGREVANGVAKFDLTLILEEREGELACVFDHDAGRFDATTMQRLAGAYARLLAGAAAGEERPVRDLPLLSEAERHQLQIELDAPAANPPELLHELLAGFARRHPEVEAVSYAGQTRSYGELAEAVARLAHALRRAGVDVGTTVGLLFPTGPALIEALFAAMAAGAAFTVVDPGQPPARTESILRAARPAVLLGDGPAMAAALPLLRDLRNDLRLLLVCRGEAPPELAAEPGIAVWDEAALACFPVRLPATGAGPDDPAYLVFTSGSTGTPKGILQPHRSFVQYLHWQAQRCDFGAPARVAQWAASTYDASYCEIFGALCFGGTLVMAPPERRYDPAAALEWLEGERVTLFQTVPSFCRHFIDALDAAAAVRPHPPLRRLRWMLLAGEPLPVDLAAAWRERCPGARLVNLYGPTECVLATFHEVGEADLRRRTVPIGRAIDGRHILILDADGGLSPLGAKGELWIRSSYLTCGYPGRPAETAAAFVPDPAGGEPGARCYRTGDVARFRVDGVLEFFGRRDFQVKIGGVRVEVEEVEAVLRSREEIRACAVVARELARGDLRLVAYIVASGEPDLPALSAWLAQRLPSAMVPAAWVLMPELPRNANGKLDRSRLPGPDLSARSTGATYAAPRTPTEAELAAIFSELLQVERVGIQDSFFAAGGHSLLATRALARIRAKYGVALPLRTFFASPTVAALAVAIAEQRAAALDTDQMSHLLARLEGLSEDEARRLLCEGP
jgi:amino acid adenylation domain-containing protein